MKCLPVLATAIAIANPLFSNAAQASAGSTPSSCNNSRDVRSYNMGLALGARIVNNAWARIRDCDRIDYFMDVVADDVSRLTVRPGSTSFTICRYTGTVDGAFDALYDLYGVCADQCFLDGQMIGELSAEVYCELAIALDGLGLADDFLRGPVETCGLNFEIGCDSGFIGLSTTYANPWGECLPYTQGDHFEVWDQARNNQCSYDLEFEDDAEDT